MIHNKQTQFPRQKLSAKAKGDKWGRENIDAIEGLSNTLASDGRSTKTKKQANYDLMNSKIDPVEYNYVTDSYGHGGKFGKTPGRLRCMNVVRNKIEKLIGDELQRPFDFGIMVVGGDGISAKADLEKQELLNTARFLLRRELGLTDEQEESENFPSLEEAAASFVSKKDIREQYASAILKNGLENDRIEKKFSEGFQHGLIVGEEIYYIGIVANGPVLRVVNPLNFSWDKSPEGGKIQDAAWCMEERYMSVPEILDEYSEYLTEKEVKDLDEGTVTSAGRNAMQPGVAYTEESFRRLENNPGSTGNSSYLSVKICCWKSMRKIGFLVYTDEDGEEQEMQVDDTYVLSEEDIEMGNTIEWQWINEAWMGTKIGNDVYVDINPIDNQMRSMRNPSECKLPYVGDSYNNMNSETTSMLDLMKSPQFLIDVLWYRTETEIAKADGKKLVMDLANMPTTHGMTMEKWMYYFKETGVVYVNSAEEGKAGSLMGPGQSTMPVQEIDLQMSNTVQQFLMVMNKLESMIDTISGVSQQAEGNIGQYETATGITQSMANSSTVTLTYFYTHDEIKRDVLTQYIETAKHAYAGGTAIQYITDDMERIHMEVDGGVFTDSDYGVFPTNSNRDKLLKQKIEALAPLAMQQDKANLSDMIGLMKASSMSEFENKLIKGEQEKEARDQEMQKMQERINAQNIEAQQAADERNHEQSLEEIRLKGEMDLRESIVQAQGFDTDKDRDGDGVPDVVEVGGAQLDAIRVGNEKANNQDNRAFQATQADLDRKLKREEMASKEKMNKDNNATALKNKVVGETKSKTKK